VEDPDLTVHPLAGYPEEVGTALWMLEDTRARTLAALDGIDPDHVDVLPPGGDNTIGALLYHVAAIELDWLCADVLIEDFPAWAYELFPDDVRTTIGHLAAAEGVPLADHLDRLARVRARLLEALRGLDLASYRRPARTGSGTVTPEWVLHHLRQHEGEHRGHLQEIRRRLET
jgi:uncharacterized damage-inducible protein DinB